ncbi:MAG: flavodoxin family protein [Alphaproteobacteria bacterium]
MKTLIIFYSRTGTTGKVASALAGRLDADLVEIRCDRFRPGPIRYLSAGYHSVKGNLPEIEVPEIKGGYDLVLIGTPIWTSYPSLPVRAFLANQPVLPDRLGLFVTYGGQSDPEIAFNGMADALGHSVEGTLALKADQVEGPGYDEALDGFVEMLTKSEQ